MGKDVRFEYANAYTIAVLQEAMDCLFAVEMEKKALADEKRKLTKELPADASEDEVKEYNAACNVIATKRKNLSAWIKTKLTDENAGFYKLLGCYDIVEAIEDGSFDKGRRAVTDVLCQVFGFNLSASKKCARMATLIADSVRGSKGAKGATFCKGTLIVSRSQNELLDTCIKAMGKYVYDSEGTDLSIHKKEFETVVFSYAKDTLAIEGFEIAERN